jgi:hypothetical protein
MATTTEVAGWMRAQVEAHGRLERRVAALWIRHAFGEEFLYRTRRGEGAIREEVLDAFRALATDGVVWSRGKRAWRRRRPSDPPGTRVAD